jgi:hypothetical protein
MSVAWCESSTAIFQRKRSALAFQIPQAQPIRSCYELWRRDATISKKHYQPSNGDLLLDRRRWSLRADQLLHVMHYRSEVPARCVLQDRVKPATCRRDARETGHSCTLKNTMAIWLNAGLCRKLVIGLPLSFLRSACPTNRRI